MQAFDISGVDFARSHRLQSDLHFVCVSENGSSLHPDKPFSLANFTDLHVMKVGWERGRWPRPTFQFTGKETTAQPLAVPYRLLKRVPIIRCEERVGCTGIATGLDLSDQLLSCFERSGSFDMT